MKTYRIAVVEDDPSYVEVLRTVCSVHSDLEVVDSFNSSEAFLGAVPELEVDAVLLDINLPRLSGLECLRELKRAKPQTVAIMLTVRDDADSILQACIEGAEGYLLKDASRREITNAIREAMNGGAPMSPLVARKVIRLVGGMGKNAGVANGGEKEVREILSSREFEILKLLAEGRKYAEIAEHLSISLPTVKTHVSHIYEKLRVRNKIEAVSRLQG